jgi:hypothetical protein
VGALGEETGLAGFNFTFSGWRVNSSLGKLEIPHFNNIWMDWICFSYLVDSLVLLRIYLFSCGGIVGILSSLFCSFWIMYVSGAWVVVLHCM